MTVLLVIILLLLLSPYLLKWGVRLWLRHLGKKMQQGVDEANRRAASSAASSSARSSSSARGTSSSRRKSGDTQGRIFREGEGTYVDFVEEKHTD